MVEPAAPTILLEALIDAPTAFAETVLPPLPLPVPVPLPESDPEPLLEPVPEPLFELVVEPALPLPEPLVLSVVPVPLPDVFAPPLLVVSVEPPDPEPEPPVPWLNVPEPPQAERESMAATPAAISVVRKRPWLFIKMFIHSSQYCWLAVIYVFSIQRTWFSNSHANSQFGVFPTRRNPAPSLTASELEDVSKKIR
jgi:hypothetical protein